MSIEAMKQALEALENVRIEYDFHGNPANEENKMIEPAIAALRQAIAEAEKQEPVGEIVHAFSDLVSVSIPKMPPVGTKLYTTPPKREWVGLTVEELKQVRSGAGYNQFMSVAEYAELLQWATEAKLKEKNHG